VGQGPVADRTDRQRARRTLGATVAWIVPADRGPRIVYPAAIVRTSAASEEAKRFLDYLRGEPAARIFQRFGFTLASVSAPTPRVALRRGKPPARPAFAKASARQAD
jgi:ABC-type Fe3+ transport system substrate-binding protein